MREEEMSTDEWWDHLMKLMKKYRAHEEKINQLERELESMTDEQIEQELDSVQAEPMTEERIDEMVLYVLERDAEDHPDDTQALVRLQRHRDKIKNHSKV